ncbi:MAG: hypothetical protein IKF82_02615 [Bacilli bacterium]|nr:hypothetical protein [Bacilli bacterium]
MEKKIPKVFANEVNSKGNNNDTFYSYESSLDNKEIKISNEKNVNQKINDIFNSSTYVYKADVLIKLKNGEVVKKIVGRNSKHLITMDNELIPISDIVDIKKQN